jgi:hypothetical protein
MNTLLRWCASGWRFFATHYRGPELWLPLMAGEATAAGIFGVMGAALFPVAFLVVVTVGGAIWTECAGEDRPPAIASVVLVLAGLVVPVAVSLFQPVPLPKDFGTPYTYFPKPELKQFGAREIGKVLQLGACPSRFCLRVCFEAIRHTPAGSPYVNLVSMGQGAWANFGIQAGHLVFPILLRKQCSRSVALEAAGRSTTLMFIVLDDRPGNYLFEAIVYEGVSPYPNAEDCPLPGIEEEPRWLPDSCDAGEA